MYRLLIVDDEPVITNGLVQLFEENPEFELDVHKAYSAKEALAIAKKMKLDILVSDIRMPQKSGLQLVDELMYYWPMCRMIFLTGYSDFEFVQEALRKNVDNYILKTEGIDPIFHAVQQACRKLDEENRRSVEEEKMKQHVKIAEPLLKNERIERIIDGEPIAALLTDTRYDGLDFGICPDRPSLFVLGCLDESVQKASREMIRSIQGIFMKDLPFSFTCEQAVYERSLLWLLQPDAELLGRFQEGESEGALSWSGVTGYMIGILESVQNECAELLGVPVSFGISGNLREGWHTIREQYETLRMVLKQKQALGQSMVITDIAKVGRPVGSTDGQENNRESDMKSLVITQIHKYIQEHLAGDVSLTAIAQEVHFNPSYLSRYYKQLTGQNLNDYIQGKRLEAAIDYMRNTDLKLQEIAARVGFDSHSYFTTFFKRKMGMSPQEFRS
ncbi:response regulator transcription factor [Paenibacillus ihbetae]|uniref:DNA-binding response regulator n=1 Tax=Paenibacillus ihbetae TaxID=1870820 RepID=A0ABX3JUD0_9BACL|nr:helix-turn-helix domain-containing protein [Paenibacillus ihbetae]OOC61281.1 DNA-binding response regulator [Paenibacillus ihbetae]